MAAAALVGLVANPALSLAQELLVAMSNGSSAFVSSPSLPNTFCLEGEECAIGDVNGDGKADLIAFFQDGYPPGVYVALSVSSKSAGANFLPRQDWGGDGVCGPGRVCTVGDVDGDGRADLIVFEHGGTSAAAVWVGRSVVLPDGTQRFDTPQLLHPGDFCLSGEICAVGDVNGDGWADLIAFQYGKPGASPTGVNVALSDGTHFVQTSNSYFCVRAEWCAVGDVNGDGKDDVIAFQHWNYGYPYTGVYVGLSEVYLKGFPPNGDLVRFVDQKGAHEFCFLNEVCAVGDVNGDGAADIIVFQHGYAGKPNTGVYVGLTELSLIPFLPSPGIDVEFATPFQVWHDNFCVRRVYKSEFADQCLVGDVDGDSLTDIVAFNHGKAPGSVVGPKCWRMAPGRILPGRH